MKEAIDSGVIGEVQSIHHIENIGYWHFAHSYVRGNWRKTSETTPEGATAICVDCPHNKSCMYSAYKYLEDRPMRQNFRDIVLRTEDNQEFLEHLLKTPYARCVYHCDNDAVDHQVVNMEYEGGITASWQASAFTMDIKRQTKIMGTKGEIEGCIEDDAFEIKDFATGNVRTVLAPPGKEV